MLKISIITATFNSANTLNRCLESVRIQTYPNIEQLIIDGASTDATLDIVKHYEDRIAFVISEKDNGIYSAWNKGVARVTGDYLMFLNSDDYLHDSTVIADLVNKLDQYHLPIAIHGQLFSTEESSGYHYIDGAPAKLSDFIFRMNFCTPAALIKREAYQTIGNFNEHYRISGDYDWAIRLFRHYGEKQIIFVPRIVAVFSVEGISNRMSMLGANEISTIVHQYYSWPQVLLHELYARGKMTARIIIPFVRFTGLLKIWRMLKQLVYSHH